MVKEKKLLVVFREKAGFEIEDKCSSIGEVSARDYLSRLLGISLNKEKSIPWLLYKYGKCLELDGLNLEVKIAFEYNGFTHTQAEVKKKDDFKKKKCKELGIKLIIINEPKRTRSAELYQLIPKQVESEFKRLGISPLNPNEDFLIKSNTAGFDLPSLIKRAKRYSSRKELKEKDPRVFNYLANTKQMKLVFPSKAA